MEYVKNQLFAKMEHYMIEEDCKEDRSKKS